MLATQAMRRRSSREPARSQTPSGSGLRCRCPPARRPTHDPSANPRGCRSPDRDDGAMRHALRPDTRMRTAGLALAAQAHVVKSAVDPVQHGGISEKRARSLARHRDCDGPCTVRDGDGRDGRFGKPGLVSRVPQNGDSTSRVCASCAFAGLESLASRPQLPVAPLFQGHLP
jgi:hypothetical protein